MIRAAMLVPVAGFPERFDWAYDNQAAALEAVGMSVVPRVWTVAGIEDDVDLVLPLVAWGYHQRFAEWLALLDRLEAKRVPVLNPVALLRWNSDKAYLAELGANGVATVPTIAVEQLDEAAVAEARATLDAEEIVIKPPVSASADGTHRLGMNDPLPDAARGRRMLVQPFQASIASAGELSLMLFDGEFSHAIIKRPKAGDFRVQPHLGGREEPCEAPESAIVLARSALAAAPGPASYARVDMVADESGTWRIMELELIEPSLFLPLAPEAPNGSDWRLGRRLRRLWRSAERLESESMSRWLETATVHARGSRKVHEVHTTSGRESSPRP